MSDDITTGPGFAKKARKAVNGFVAAGAGAAAASLTAAFTDGAVTSAEWLTAGSAFLVVGLIAGFTVYQTTNEQS